MSNRYSIWCGSIHLKHVANKYMVKVPNGLPKLANQYLIWQKRKSLVKIDETEERRFK